MGADPMRIPACMIRSSFRLYSGIEEDGAA